MVYQWFKQGILIPGANLPRYAIASATADDAATYRCRVTGPGGVVQSDNATLTVRAQRDDNGSHCERDSAPSEMEAGQTVLIGVMVRNTSDVSWSPAQGYSLAIIDDPCGLFGGATRIPLPDDFQAIQPGGVANFVAPIQAPLSLGDCSASVRMIEENVEFFGDVGVVTITSVDRPNAALDWEIYE